MGKFSIIVWLLPIVFMIHDFEEIIFFKSWLNKNREYLTAKFPKITKRLPFFNHFSTSAFAFAVAEEFVLLSLITLFSVIFNCYFLWLAAFMGFFAHLLMHVGQWIVFRRYIPAIFTTFFALIYCIYALYELISNNIFLPSEFILWSIIGIVILVPVFLLLTKVAEIFNKKRHNFIKTFKKTKF